MIRDSVDILDIMKPVYNFKASEDDLPWKKKKENKDDVSFQYDNSNLWTT